MPTYALKCPKCSAVLRFQTRPESDVAVFCSECGHCFDPPEAGKIDTPIVKAVPIQAPAPKPTVRAVSAGNAGPAGNAGQASSTAPGAKPPQANASGKDFDPFESAVPTKKPTHIKGSIFSWPLIVGVGCLLMVFSGILFFVVFDGAAVLASLNPLAQSPKALASNYASHVEQFEKLVNGVSEGDKPDWSKKHLEELAVEVEDLGIRVAKLLETDTEEIQSLRTQLEATINQRESLAPKIAEYEDRYRPFSPINIAIRRIDQAGKAIEKQLSDGLVKLHEGESSVLVVAKGIQIERRLVRSLAEVTSSEGVAKAVESTQAFSDRLNELAEKQASEGERIGLIPRDYKNAESAAATLRTWLQGVIKSRHRPSPEFSASLKDFAQMEMRFDNSLFSNDIDQLNDSAATRVAAILSGRGGVISSNGPQATDLAQNDSDSRTRATSPFSVPSQPNDPAFNDTASNDSVPDVPGWGKSSGGSEDSPNSTPATRRDPGPEDPFGMSSSSPSSGSPANVDPQPVPASDPMNPFGDSSQLSAKELQTLKGPNVIVIRVDGVVPGGDLNQLRRQLATKLQCRRSSADESPTEFVISLDYQGALSDVVRQIDFGTVDISDSQSRTIFVTADKP